MSAIVSKLKSLFSKGIAIFPEEQGQKVEYLSPSFSEQNDLLIGDLDIFASIKYEADIAVGGGFETTMDESYVELTADKRTAKHVVDDYCLMFRLDELAQEVAKDVIGFGNNFLWTGVPLPKIEKLVRIVPAGITSLKFNDDWTLKSVVTRTKTFDANELIWFSIDHYGEKGSGVGMLKRFLASYRNREPFATIKADVQSAMAKQIKSFSAYNEMICLPGVSDDKIAAYNAKFQTLKEGGRVVTNVAGTIERSIPERMRGLDFYVETLWNSFYLGLGTPYAKIVLGGSFTEASAQAAASLGYLSIFSLRRYLKRTIETQIFDSLIAQEGLDPFKAHVRLTWREIQKPDVNVVLPVLAKLAELGYITKEQLLKFLEDIGTPLPKRPTTEVTTTTEPPKTNIRTAEFDQPITSELRKHTQTPKVAE